MRAAVLGSPIAHSLSPVLHTAGYRALGLADWQYDAHRVEADDLLGFVAALGPEWRGLSLTMPLKQACLLVADEVSAVAQRAGAANTLVRLADGGWRADNTDIHGLAEALRPVWPGACAAGAVLGAGSTARSAALALADLGVTRLTVYARDAAKAHALADWALDLGVGLSDARVGDLAAWGAGDEPVVVSALPPGTGVEAGLVGRDTGVLLDVVYADWPTPLATAATAAGLTVVGGLDLLVHQAARQFELFTGHAAPVDAMLAAGRAALSGSPA